MVYAAEAVSLASIVCIESRPFNSKLFVTNEGVQYIACLALVPDPPPVTV